MNFWKGLGKFLWKILAGVGVILGIFQWGVKLKVSAWVIPSWILLLLLVVTIAVVGYIAYFVGHNPKIATIPVRKEPKINVNDDEAFILAALAVGRNVPRDELHGAFLEKLKGKDDADFNISLNKLEILGFVRSSGSYVTGQEFVEITATGLEYCEKLRDSSKRS
jgi:hypothetical protein